MRKIILVTLLLLITSILYPIKFSDNGIIFEHQDDNAQSVYLVGSMNDWDTTATPMNRDDDGIWRISLNLNYGDVIIFSTLLLHRSLPTKFPRLSLPMLTKNFKSNDISFQDIRSFENYSFSELTKIQRILGNHFLSPYRLKKL